MKAVRRRRPPFIISLLLVTLIAVSCSAPAATPTRAPTPTPLPTATPRTARTAEQVTLSLPTSQFMDARHSARNVGCQSCHAQSSNAAPSKETCLTCHGGAYSVLAAKTAGGRFNPHQSHNGDLACAECHRMHEPFQLHCHSCHEEYSSDRYR